jgi:competence protein ComEA
VLKLSRQEQYIILFLVLAILSGSVVALVRKHSPALVPEKYRLRATNAGGSTFFAPGAAKGLDPEKVIIHITGAVNKPGVYHFNREARVINAIDAAGGPKEGAILDILNLAQPLVDGSRIIIPQKFDAEAFRQKLLSLGPDHVYTTEEIELAYLELEAREEERAKKEKKKAKPASGKMNINTVSQSQIESLPNIGPARAQAIIANRPYSSPEEITKIHGIGPKIYEALKDKIVAE